MTDAIICWCGHHAKYHSTQIPNKCSKCDKCQYFSPISRSLKSKRPYSGTMKARFNGTCKVCELAIKAGKHEITKDDSGNWIHASCSDAKDKLP